jgi:putative heme-binding domain-containing protein
MLNHYDAETPAIRSTMFTIFRNSPKRLESWLSAMENGTLANHRIDANQIQSLKQITGELAPRIAKLLEGRVQSNRQTLVDRTLQELTDQGLIETNPANQSTLTKTDRQRGKQLFAQHCSACHRVDSIGTNIGPDISDSRTQTPVQLLVSILDPNRAIDNQYFRVSVRLNDGSVHDGIVSEESGEHITLKTQQNPSLSIPKNSIEELVSSGVSLMPEGFESQLTTDALADLIDYLKNWRYIGGESPQR